MGSLGTIFRREREARGISLEEIAEKTKIGARLLRAIENEQFDRLPGGIFNRSFVRQYARFLGVDEEIAVREYLQAFRSRRETPPAPRSRPTVPQNFSADRDYSRIATGVAGLVVLVAGIAYGAYRLHGYLTAAPAAAESPASASLTAPPVVPLALPAPAAVESLPASVADPEPPAASPSPERNVSSLRGDSPISQAFPSPEAAEGSVQASAPAPLLASSPASLPPSPEELQLRIDSHGPVWLSIMADGVRQWQGTMRANQTREVQATESVRLTVGDAAAVSLTLNGRSLPGLGRSGEVRNLTITARDATESAP